MFTGRRAQCARRPYAEIHKVLKKSKLEVKGGSAAVNKDDVQMKCTVVPDAGKWALILSISHTIADGFTYYAVQPALFFRRDQAAEHGAQG